jgi:methylmalonyl-CoA mutase
MESMYQRTQIQEESMYYETLKHNGQLPVIGVNTFLAKDGSPTVLPTEVIRSTEGEKERQIQTRQSVQARFAQKSEAALQHLQETAIRNENTFEALMEASKQCTLGQLTHTLYQVGGQYRRNM